MSKTVILNLTLLLALCKSCPFPCICRWKNGKQTSECVNKDLLVIPEGLDSTTQVLEFAGNNLRTLHREKFVRLDLINLQRIHLSRCRISMISEATFRGLTNLVELDLSDNLLDAIPSAAFHDCTSLMRLSLSRNPIKIIEQNAFNYLSFLNTLELSNCDISRVDEDAFQGLYSLEWLHLEANKMAAFTAALRLPSSLKGIQLQENPWRCDCHLRDLQEFLLKFGYPFSIEPLCSSPREMSGKIIRTISIERLACLPEVTPTMLYLEIDEGKNISLACEVDAIPEASISWHFEGHLLQNDTYLAPGLRLLYYLEHGTTNKRSELYIRNANKDDSGTFVCSAENSAGISNVNYTVRILIKHEVTSDEDNPPFEFILVVTFATSLSVLLLIVIVTFAVAKCRRKVKMRRKRYESKVALGSSSGDNLFKESLEESSETVGRSQTMQGPSMVALEDDQLSMKFYQEQNPDLINGTDVMKKSECGVLERHYSVRNVRFGCETIVGDSRDMFVVPTEVGLHSGAGCYKTLPNKKRIAIVPAGRLSREVEFLNRSVAAQTHQPYEFFGNDIRHTADGYPARSNTADSQHHPMGEGPPLQEDDGDIGAPSRISVGCGPDAC